MPMDEAIRGASVLAGLIAGGRLEIGEGGPICVYGP